MRPPDDDWPVYYDEVSLAETAVVPTPTPTAALIPTPTPISPTPSTPPTTPSPTPTLTPGQAGLTFKIKFQGITGENEKPSQTVRVILRQDNQEDLHDVQVVYDSQGIFSGTISGINPGTYDILIKGWIHLQKKFANVILNEGENNQDWSSSLLLAGDFNNDNVLNIMDISAILAQYTQLVVPINDNNKIYDVNLDNQIDISDIALVLANYTQLEVHGDE